MSAHDKNLIFMLSDILTVSKYVNLAQQLKFFGILLMGSIFTNDRLTV